ncbi:MAG: sodium:proton antiporter NhaD [Chlamydiales bacterium]|nr:sodium:proton antiporter NhaD [Chlamydiales bacterium]
MEMIPVAALTAILIAFFAGYFLIVFEHNLKINKAAAALLMAVVCWSIYFVWIGKSTTESVHSLLEHFSSVGGIVFFLLGAMTIVELIDSHKGFKIITDFITVRSKKKLLWSTGFIAFFLSSVLDNLTATIVMVSLLRKLIPDKEDQKVFGAMMVIATNAGGAWTPIGDVTTTMLWIGGQISSIGIIKALFLPSVVCLAVPLFFQSFLLKGEYAVQIQPDISIGRAEPKAKLIFWVGVGSLIFVPIFKMITGLPPFMGILLGLGIMWLVTDLVHYKYEQREHLRVPHILTRVDVSGVLFFLGILLAVNVLDVTGLLKNVAIWLSNHVPSQEIVAGLIGLASAIIDNVPLVAATMGMYDLSTFPIDSKLWEMIAYAAGTGGSILIIGSAAGVAFMGLEKVSFMWYLRRVSFLAFIGYIAGFLTYLATTSWV